MLSLNSSKFLARRAVNSSTPLLRAASSSCGFVFCSKRTSSSTQTTSAGLFSSSRLLREAKTSSSSADLAEIDEEEAKRRQEEDDDLSTEVQEEEEDQPFDVVEATMQEIHDLVVAMKEHKMSSAFLDDATANWAVHRDRAGEVEYQSYKDWEKGHALFEEWCDKLEKLLTKDIMKSIVRSAEFFDLHPSQKAFEKIENFEELTSNPENHSGFSKHPLSYSAASGPEFKSPHKLTALNRFTDAVPATRRQLKTGTTNSLTEVQMKKEEHQRGAAKFFMHGPYQIQIARPDASPELMSQARSYRDRNTLFCLQELISETHHMRRQLPVKDRLRMIKLMSDVMLDEEAETQF